MSEYDHALWSQVERSVYNSLSIIERLEEEKGMSLDDAAKARLVGDLSVSASITSLMIYSEIKTEAFAHQLVQELVGSGLAVNLASNVGKQIADALTKREQG